MRIALVLTASTGGIGRHVATLVPRLLQRGHQIRVFCPASTNAAHGFAPLGVDARPLSQLAAARGAEVIHAHGYKAGVLAAGLAALIGRPLVVTWHNAVLGSHRAATMARLVQGRVARAADLTLGASSDLVVEALRLGAPAARLGPVAAPVLPPPRTPASAVRNGLGLTGEQTMILTVSRLAPQKNLGLVLDIAAGLRDRPDVSFAIVGDGPEHDPLAARIAAESLAVTLLGRRDDIADLLAAADLALLTSTWEARALVAQEALLAGLPLVSTRVGGIEELVGKSAELVELGDSAAAAAVVRALVDDPGRRAALRAAGLVQAATWPNEDDVADDVVAAYAQVVSEAAARQLGIPPRGH